MWSSVDLPAPDGPMIDTNSPGLMSIAMRRRTNVCPAPTGKDFSTPRMDITGAPGVDSQGSATLSADARLKNMCQLRRDSLSSGVPRKPGQNRPETVHIVRLWD